MTASASTKTSPLRKRSPKPWNRIKKLRNFDPKPETRDSEPETRYSEPKTRSPTPYNTEGYPQPTQNPNPVGGVGVSRQNLGSEPTQNPNRLGEFRV